MKTVFYVYSIDEHTNLKTSFKGEFNSKKEAEDTIKKMSGRFFILEVYI